MRRTTLGAGIRTAMLALLAAACGTGGGGPQDADDTAQDVVDGGPHDGGPRDQVAEDGGEGVEDGGARWVWPNEESRANSDPWLAEHHAEVVEMRPRVLVLNFVNAKTNDELRPQLEEMVEVAAEASRYHGFDDHAAPVFLRYELAYVVDLRDATPPDGWPYRNSTLYPREDPPTGTWGFDYERLFGEEFAALYGITDPDDPAHDLDLCELLDRGLVHEVWVVADGDVPDAGAAEILELKPWYDANRQRRDRPLNRCAGNGCFDDDDLIPADCTRTVRIAFFNHTRGPGCFLESLSHSFESIGAWNPGQLPSLSRDFIPFANYALDTRHGLTWDSWYQCPMGVDCLSYPTETSVTYDLSGVSGTIDPYDPVCGNVHFAPNARSHYDLVSPATVQTSCVHFRRGDGPGGTDALAPFNRTAFRFYERFAPDCQGPFLVWWRQNFPGLDNGLTDDAGSPILNWWPYIYY